MNNILFSQVLQSLKYLNSKPSNEAECDPLEVIVLYEIIKIDWEQLEWDH